MVKTYAEILHSPNYLYTYKFSFWDFLSHGYKKFLPELDPYTNFKIHDFASPDKKQQEETRQKLLESIKQKQELRRKQNNASA